MGLADRLGDISPRALDDWVNGERDTPACIELSELAAGVKVAELRELAASLSSEGENWLVDANVERFLGLIVALLASPKSDISCAAATTFLAALRCRVNASPALKHALVFHELCKALPNALCGGTGSATPAPRKKKSGRGKKKQQQQQQADSDDDDPMAEDNDAASAMVPAEDADALAEQLRLFLEAVPLRGYADTLSQLVARLVEAAARGAGARVYQPLTACLGSEHGEPLSTARAVLRSVKPSLALMGDPSSSVAAGSSASLEAQRSCVDFLLRLCKHSAECEPARGGALQHVVQALLQHASVAAPDKAESRDKVCSALCTVLAALPPAEAVRYAGFLWRYSRTSKVSARMFSVEMACTVLLAAAAAAGASPPHDDAGRATLGADGVPQLLWRLLAQRVSDKAPGVRTKSLAGFAVLLVKLPAEPGRRVLQQAQLPIPEAAAPVEPEAGDGDGMDVASPLPGGGRAGASPAAVGSSTALISPAAASEAASSLPALGSLLQQRCVDERPAVRRAALQAIEAWTRASGMSPSGSQLKLIARGCADVSPAIRKQATRSLWSMLQAEPESAALQAAWTSAILPLAADPEATVCDACLDTVLEGVLHPLARAKKPREMAGWPLLLQLPDSALPFLQRAVRRLASQKRLPSGLAPKLQALLAEPAPEARERPVVWSMLHEVAELPPADVAQQKLDHTAVLRCWRQASGGADAAAAATAAAAADSSGEAASALRLLVSLSDRGLLGADAAASLRSELDATLQKLEAPPQLTVLLVQACASFATAAERPKWAEGLLRRFEPTLLSAAADPRKLRVALTAAGELALIAPHAASAGLVAKLQGLAHGSGDAEQAVAPTSRAEAFVALGKLCVSSADLAQRLTPVFIKALTTHELPAVRTNALVVLFDLAKKHTALLERHLSTMALALYDVVAAVRHKALLLFSQLLLEDFIKWRPSVFRAFCVALADPEAAVRSAAHVCLFQLLLPRSPLLAFNSFVGLLFQINGYMSHPQHSATLLAAEAAALEPLRGEGERAQRRRLMVFRPLLGAMTSEHKLQTMAKLCHDVLAAVPDGQLPLDDTQGVLSDALLLLACKEIKLAAADGAANGAVDEATEGDAGVPAAAAAAANAARGKLLSQVARKATVEAIVPVVVELKRHLEQQHSPLLRDLFLFLRELLRDHKQYLQDILSRDKQLASEIEYDMKQLDATRARALQTVSPAALSTNARSPAARPFTPQAAPASKGKATAMRVPTPKQLNALSIPRVRRTPSATSGGGLAAAMSSAGRSGGAPLMSR